MMGGGPKRPWWFSLNLMTGDLCKKPFVILSGAQDLAFSRIREMSSVASLPQNDQESTFTETLMTG